MPWGKCDKERHIAMLNSLAEKRSLFVTTDEGDYMWVQFHRRLKNGKTVMEVEIGVPGV
jgi:hypothetical protein